jgi:hypothetical protein
LYVRHQVFQGLSALAESFVTNDSYMEAVEMHWLERRNMDRQGADTLVWDLMPEIGIGRNRCSAPAPQDMVVLRTIVGTGLVEVAHVSPFVVDAHMGLDRAALVAAYWVAEVVAVEDLHSCMAAVVAQVQAEGCLASAVVVCLRLAFVQVVQEALVAYTVASCWTSSPRDPAEPAVEDRLSSYGSCLAPAVLRQRCWRKLRPAERKRPGQTGSLLGHSPGPVAIGIAPCCDSSAGALFVCTGAESVRHPALLRVTAHCAVWALDSDPYPCLYQGGQGPEGLASSDYGLRKITRSRWQRSVLSIRGRHDVAAIRRGSCCETIASAATWSRCWE